MERATTDFLVAGISQHDVVETTITYYLVNKAVTVQQSENRLRAIICWPESKFSTSDNKHGKT